MRPPGPKLNPMTTVDPNLIQTPIVELELATAHITLLGTAHVSATSVASVRELIESGKFDAVAVELCPSRYNALFAPETLEKLDLLSALKSGKGPTLIANLFLGGYQQRIGEELGVEPGADMRTAVELAQSHKLPVSLIDREIGVTLRRAFHRLSVWRKTSLVAAFMAGFFNRESVSAEDVERLKSRDMISSIVDEFAREEIDLFEPLIDERDRYMCARIQQSVKEGDAKRWLVVIGAGHLPGIERRLRQPSSETPESEIAQLDALPAPSRWPKIFGWTVVGIILVGFIIGFMRGPGIGWDMVSLWFVVNGTLSALGATLARGRPLTILTAFLAAPFTSLNPTISAGVVAAGAEFYQAKPTVRDFMAMRSATQHWKGWWQNRVSRILLVFVFASVGSALGTYLAGFLIFDRLVAG